LLGRRTQLDRFERDAIPLTVDEPNDLGQRLARKLDDLAVDAPAGRKPAAQTVAVDTVADSSGGFD